MKTLNIELNVRHMEAQSIIVTSTLVNGGNTSEIPGLTDGDAPERNPRVAAVPPTNNFRN